MSHSLICSFQTSSYSLLWKLLIFPFQSSSTFFNFWQFYFLKKENFNTCVKYLLCFRHCLRCLQLFKFELGHTFLPFPTWRSFLSGIESSSLLSSADYILSSQAVSPSPPSSSLNMDKWNSAFSVVHIHWAALILHRFVSIILESLFHSFVSIPQTQRANCLFIEKGSHISGLVQFKPVLFKGQLFKGQLYILFL